MRVTGHILGVQEQRFRLRADAGQVYLLTLGRHARQDASLLSEYQRRNVHVLVDYSGQPNLSGGTAHSVCPAS